jgi:cytochrome P450
VGSWVLTRHEDCLSVLRDTERFASDWRRIGELVPEPRLTIQTLDPPEHTGIRHFLVEAFHNVDRHDVEWMIAGQVRARLGRLCRQSSFDCVSEFAAPLALEMIVAILGAPPLDPEWFLPVSQAIVDGMDAGIWPETGPPAVAAKAELAKLTGGWLDRRRGGGGLLDYIAARAATSGVARPVLLNSLRAVLHAGFESAGRLLGNGMAVLLADPDALSRLARSDHARAVDELVRFNPPVQAVSRACVSEVRIGDHVIAPGDAVTLLLGAANRDPARFRDPDALDFARHPNAHLGFGRGAHSCLGQFLATLQARVVFGVLAMEYPGIRAVSQPAYRRNLTLRGLARLDARIG